MALDLNDPETGIHAHRKDVSPVRRNARARARMMARRRVTTFYASAVVTVLLGVLTVHVLPFHPYMYR